MLIIRSMNDKQPLSQEALDRRFALDLQNIADLAQKRGRKFLIVYETKDGAASVHNMNSQQLITASEAIKKMITRSNIQEGVDRLGEIKFDNPNGSEIPKSN